MAHDHVQRRERGGDGEELAGEADAQPAVHRLHRQRGHQQRRRDQPQADPGPRVGAVDDVLEATPGRIADRGQQRDQHHALHRHALLALGGVVGHQAVERGLPALRIANGQVEIQIGPGQHVQLQRAGEQQRHPHEQEHQRHPPHARALRAEGAVGGEVVRGVVGAEQQRHDQADADAEGERQHEARNRQIRPDDAAGVDQRQDVGRRREEQEGDRRAEARALLVDAGEERNDGARAHRQQRTRGGGGRVGHGLAGVAPEEAGDGLLGDQRRHRAGDEEGRQQAQQHVGREIGGQIAQTAIEDGKNPGRQRIHDMNSSARDLHPAMRSTRPTDET